MKQKLYLIRFQVVLASYDHRDVAPSCSSSPPIFDIVNGDETEMAYVVTVARIPKCFAKRLALH